MPRPRVHEAADVPVEIRQELAQSFDLVEAATGADGVVTTPAIKVDTAFLDTVGSQLRIVANYAVGIDNIDFDAVRERGVVVQTEVQAEPDDRLHPPILRTRGRKSNARIPNLI